jgi:hypothetical protein
MNGGVLFSDELKRIKKKIDQTWDELFEKDPVRKREGSQWIEKLPKFEGTRRTSRSRLNKSIKSF